MLLFNKALLFVAVSICCMLLFAALTFAASAEKSKSGKEFIYTKDGKQKIKKVVHLMLENRAYDQVLGWANFPGATNQLTGEEWNPVSTIEKNSPRVYVTKNGKANFQVLDPDHSTYATTAKIFGLRGLLDKEYGKLDDERMDGFVEWEYLKHKKSPNTTAFSVMDMMAPENVPTLINLASEYAVFDRFFASIPGPTWPNRIMAIGPESRNTETYFFQDGINGNLYTQETIFDQLEKEGKTWQIVVGDVLWENFFAKIAYNPQNVIDVPTFRELAAKGELADYTFINPPGSVNLTANTGAADCHPAHSLTNCFNFLNDMYTIVRNSPLWNESAFIMSFDEHGGFYSKVKSPINVPSPVPGKSGIPDFYFKFDRLGIRIPFIVASPYTPAHMVVTDAPAAQKPFNNSEYDLTSIMATVRKVFDMKAGNLTPRDGWASTFEHVFSLDEPRTDCPQTLVPMPEDKEWSAKREAENPISDLQKDIAKGLHQLTDGMPIRKTPHYKSIKTSGEYAQWAADTWMTHREHFALHQKGTKQSQDEYSLILTGVLNLEAVLLGEKSWNIVNGSSCGIPDRWIIYSRKLRDPHTKNPYCLTWNINGTEHTSGSVTAEPCYPSPEPCKNQNVKQQWKLDYTGLKYMPFLADDMCLTAVENPFPSAPVSLAKCTRPNILQRWNYQGLPDSIDNSQNNAKLCCGMTGGELLYGNGVYGLFMKPNHLSMDDIKKLSVEGKRKEKEIIENGLN